MIIFKTKSSVTGSKVCKVSPVKEVSEEAGGFGGGKLFLMVRICSVKYSQKTIGRTSESKAERRDEEKFFARHGVEVLKELFTSGASLQRSRFSSLYLLGL